MPAGRVLGVLVIALAIAALFNSEALVRAGEGMQPGTTRDIVLSVGRPLDDVAGAVGLHLPREGLDRAFGQEDKTASGTRAGARLDRDPAAERRKDEQQRFVQPTKEDPLDVLVTGRLAGGVPRPAAGGPVAAGAARGGRRSPATAPA